MRLIPYQVKLLEEEYFDIMERKYALVDSIKNGQDIQENKEKVKRLCNRSNVVLSLVIQDPVNEVNNQEISIGSTFAVNYIDEDYKEEVFTLIESRVSTEDESFVTLNNRFGASVVGKKVGDIVPYKYGTFVGDAIISKIYTKEEQEEYFETFDRQKVKTL